MKTAMTKNWNSSESGAALWRTALGAISRVSGVLLCLLLLARSEAHQQKNAVTQILFNENTGNIEVVHRFFVHDAEHAAGLIFGERQMLAESSESREMFSSYVINRFSIEVFFSKGESEVLGLSYVGEEIDGQFIWVYQEIPVLDGITAMTIVNLALRDVWSDQSNLVNIERDGRVYSLTFEGAAEMLTVELGA